MKLNTKTGNWSEVGKWLGFTIIALLSGLVGGYFIFNLLSPSIGSLVLNDVSSDMMKRERLTIREAKNVVVEHDANVQSVAADLSQNLLAIVRKVDASAPDWQKKYITKELVVAEAVPVTTDGWLVTNFTGLIDSDGKLDSGFFVMDRNGTTFIVEKIINDQFTKLQFVKVKASSLSVKKFSATQIGQNGSEYISADWARQVELRVLKASRIGKSRTSVKSADDTVEYLDLSLKLNSLAVVNHGGEIVGFNNSLGEVVSAQSVNEDFAKILDSGVVTRPKYGFNYIDLNAAIHASSSANSKKPRGALVVIDKAVPSTTTVLKNGDIIKTVDGEDVEKDLLDYLLRSKLGQELQLGIERSGQLIQARLRVSAIK